MGYCKYCMSEIKDGSPFCPLCGKDLKTTEPMHHLQPGTLLAGKYEIGAALGEGGFGITYLGLNKKLDLKVAIKEYFPFGYVHRVATISSTVTERSETADESFFEKGRERFLSEAKTLAKLYNQDGVVSVLDFFEDNNTAYIVMEYLDGETLKAYLNKKGRISYDETLSLLMPVMRSLSKVHEKGLIHRDIAPDNIMITEDKVKLLDFGAARYTDGGNRSLSVMLKHGYAPEEQYRKKGEQGPWTDVYALSATIYKCITGTTPDEATERIHKDELKAPSAYGVQIDPRCEAALMKGLCINAENRYRTVNDLIKGLEGKDDKLVVAAAGTGVKAAIPNKNNPDPDRTVTDEDPDRTVYTNEPEDRKKQETVSGHKEKNDKPEEKRNKNALLVILTALLVIASIIGAVIAVSLNKGREPMPAVPETEAETEKRDEDAVTTNKVIETEQTAVPSTEPPTETEVHTEAVTEPVRVADVSFYQDHISLTEGSSAPLSVIITPDNAADKSVTWRSNDTGVATVDGSGTVRAVEEGVATITVTTNDGNKSASCTVNVVKRKVGVTGVSLNNTSLTLIAGNTYTLKATVSPNDATNKTVSWSTSDPSVATVDGSGTVTAKISGSAVISVTTGDGKKTAACTVSVIGKYTATWSGGKGYSVAVNRTSSPNAKAGTGKLSSGADVYSGDVLEIVYNIEKGYTLSSKGKTQITVSGNVSSKDIYASVSVNKYTVSWSTGTGYKISVDRIESPYGGAAAGTVSNGSRVYYGDVLSITYTASTGFTITSKGRNSFTVSGDLSSSDIYATASANKYSASWSSGTGCTITVKRTESPYGGAAAGTISSGASVYYGDVLSVTYSASTGFTLTEKGKTSITVSGNVSSTDIYATASVNKYTANWSSDAGYSVTVKRTSSPYAGAPTGSISRGSAIYYGDVLNITYTAAAGYTVTDKGETSITVTGNVSSKEIYATASLIKYTAIWSSGTGYTISVSRTESPHAGATLGNISSGAAVYYGDVLSITYASTTGFTLTGKGKTSVTVTGNVTSDDIYATAAVQSFTAKWNAGEYCTINVKRTESPYAGASTGKILSNATVYYGDKLSISYTANTGYSMSSNGSTSITVTRNITSNDIYGKATPNSYTYNIVYVSKNGTNLGTSSATYKYGTTNTITAPNKSGYQTPASQNVKWDSTSAKTITFVYDILPAKNPAVSGIFIDSRPKITYTTSAEYRNRTANSVEVRFTTTVTIQTGWTGFQHGIAYEATCGSVNSGVVQVSPYYALQEGGSSHTGSSDWIRVSLNTTNATSCSFRVYMYQNNLSGVDLSANYGYSSNNYTWTVNVPAY